jgi:hypothetical protein
MRFKYVPFFFIIHCFFLLSYEASPDSDHNSHNAPHVKIQVNNYNAQPPNNCHFSANVTVIPDYSHKLPADYSVIMYEASPALKNYFTTIVSPLMYDAMIKNHHAAIPGYTFSDGLRHCIHQLSQFSRSDAALIVGLTKRLETYCTLTESLLFNGENHFFCDTISHEDYVKLATVYADFLKEFYAQAAPHIFYKQSQESPLMQHVMPSIKWGCYDGNDSKSSLKKIKQQHAASVNGNLGAVYKALHEGDSEKAYTIGQQRVIIAVSKLRKIEKATSVFESYPHLFKVVEQARLADKAKNEQERITKQNFAQQGAMVVKAKSQEYINLNALIPDSEVLQQRNDTAICQVQDSRFFKQQHNVVAEQAECIDIEHLTSDQKGILLDGGYLQHHIIDETISVVDVVISNDLAGNMHDAVIDLANISLTLNKEGDVVMATRTLDACWALIDYAQDAARYAYLLASTHFPFVAKGVCDGVCESLHGAVHTVCHPVEAVQDAAQSLAIAGYYLGKAVYKAGEYESMIDFIETQPHSAQEMLQKLADEPSVLLALCEQAKKNISSEDVARVGTKTILDMMLFHSATKAVSAIAHESWAEFISCMRKGEQSSEVALTAENISVQVGEEIASVMENMQKVGGGTEVAAEVANNSAKSAAAEVKRYGKQGSPYQKISKSTQQHVRPLNSLEGKELIGIENISVSGYGPLPKRIYLDKYKHYLQPEFRTTSGGKLKPSGWHHDPGRRIENIKRINGYAIEIENYKKHSSGIYKFDWIISGTERKTSTLFPHTWSREIVQQKIIEAYKYARKNCCTPVTQPNGNFAVNGFTNEGISIKIIINKNGNVVTAYPIWPK